MSRNYWVDILKFGEPVFSLTNLSMSDIPAITVDPSEQLTPDTPVDEPDERSSYLISPFRGRRLCSAQSELTNYLVQRPRRSRLQTRWFTWEFGTDVLSAIVSRRARRLCQIRREPLAELKSGFLGMNGKFCLYVSMGCVDSGEYFLRQALSYIISVQKTEESKRHYFSFRIVVCVCIMLNV